MGVRLADSRVRRARDALLEHRQAPGAVGHGYALGFPRAGRWVERFNSDVYDNWVNPMVAGNGGGVTAYEGGRHGLPAHAEIVIPANSVLVFSLA